MRCLPKTLWGKTVKSRKEAKIQERHIKARKVQKIKKSCTMRVVAKLTKEVTLVEESGPHEEEI